jgi:hypothetical protein
MDANWWKKMLTAHLEKKREVRALLGTCVIAWCGEVIPASRSYSPSNMELGADPMFYPQCQRCRRNFGYRG